MKLERGERSLPLALLLSALEKPQPKIKEESHIIHFETLILFAKNETLILEKSTFFLPFPLFLLGVTA
jgi:hypothetical protein